MKKRNIKSILFCFIMISLLCIGCKPKYTGEDYEAIHTCEVVEDITQEEIVSFENMLIRYRYTQNWLEECEKVGNIYYTLCIFSDGSVYCIKEYHKSGSEHLFINCNDEVWQFVTDVYYLGKLSGEDLFYLNFYISEVNFESDYYFREMIDTIPTSEENVNLQDEAWISCGGAIVREMENGDEEHFSVEARRHEGDRIIITLRTYDRNAIKAMDILTESWFYEKWLELIFEGAE